MKALSIRQPWAELILQGKKKIEIRAWTTKLREVFLIHASKNVDRELIWHFGLENKALSFGAIVGYARLAEVIAYNTAEGFAKDASLHLSIEKKEKYPVYGFVLEYFRRVKPIAYKGKLGFFEVPEIGINDLESWNE